MHIIGRRRFIAGLGLGTGAHLLGAMVRSLLPQAMGQQKLRKRFVIYVNSLSVPAQYLPKAGPGDAGVVLGDSFAPLEPYRGEVLFLNKLFNPFNKDLHGNRWPMAVAPEADGRGPGDISIDRLIGAALVGNAPFPSLNLLPTAYFQFRGESADGKGKPFPGQSNPVKAYTQVFGGDAVSGLSPEQRLARRQSLLDFLRTDITKVQGLLAGAEREKMDQYLDTVRATERRLTTLVSASASCARPGAIDPALGSMGRDVRVEMFNAHMDIAVSALACGLTPVVAIQCDGDFFESGHYVFLGEDGLIGAHSQWHGDPNVKKHIKLYSFHAANVAAMRARLGAIRDGNGTVADNTLFAMMNAGGGQHHDGWNTHWMLLLGNVGGALKTGRVINYNAKRCLSDAYTSIANAVGVPVPSVGTPSACMGPLPDLT